MKFEIWSEKSKKFEQVELNESQYDEMLLCFYIAKCEVEIEGRITEMKHTRLTANVEENVIFFNYD
jgi:hypothetical protein